MSEDEGRLIAGRYRLQSRIGSGAMGVVWRAVDDRLDRTVAVKQLLLPPGLNEAEADRARQRAFREGRIAARLQHPNAISVYNVAEDAGQPVLVMEYLPSRSLSAVLAERHVLPPTEVARLGAQVASALTAAHAAGVIHRDVKPGNILLGDDGITKITDFGISRAAGDITVTSTGLLAGTPAFLSPEAARGAEPGPASDVFSLGATLYAAVEGTPPFGAVDNEIALLHTVATGTTIPPRQAGPLTGPLQAMLQTEPASRPTMAQVAEALRSVADGGAGLPSDPPTVPAMAAVPPAPPRRPATRVDLHAAAPGPAGSPPPAAPTRTRRGGARVAVTALAVLAAAAVGILVAELVLGATGGAGSPQAGAAPTTEMSRSSPGPTTTTTTSQAPSAEELEQAVAEYYALLPDDTDSAWRQLGPGLRGQGRDTYEDFWDGVERVSIVGGPRALDTRTVQVQLDFTTDDGKVTREVHRLGMDTTSSTPRIDSDRVVSSRVVKKPGDDKDDKDGKEDKDDGKDSKDSKDDGKDREDEDSEN